MRLAPVFRPLVAGLALLLGLGAALSPDRVIVNPLRVSPTVQNELQYNLLLAFTGKSRISDRIIEDQVGRYVEKQGSSVDALRRLKAISVEMKNCIVGGELEHFGPLLHEQWEQKKQLSARISTPELDTIYETARGAGATGGKVTGAGGGSASSRFPHPLR